MRFYVKCNINDMQFKTFKLINTLVGWFVFAIAATVYLLTIEPTASFWDCGEFISSAYKLDVGHPPGAPFFMLMGHFASLFASGADKVAMCVNALSALASAFTILFLFWTITALAVKLLKPDSVWKAVAVLGAGAVGALAYTFSDTFWFSAVEGEVYASSSLFTAVVFWLILKWDEQADSEGSDKWLILIAYLMGLSIGVHLLNLLTIPAIVLVYYFRKYDFSWLGLFLAMLSAVGILAFVLYGLIPGSIQLACWAELLFVNGFGLPFNTGLWVYIVLTALACVWAIVETHIEKSRTRMAVSFVLAFALAGVPFLWTNAIIGIVLILALFALLLYLDERVPARLLNTTAIMIAVMLIGYGSYAAIVIRSSADTPMDQNSPDNVFSLQSYLNREQYGDRPLLYGQVYNAPVELKIEGNICIPIEKTGAMQYAPAIKENANEKDHYKPIGNKISYKYMKEFCMLFPRMYSTNGEHIKDYKDWGEVHGKRVRYEYCGQTKSDIVPTFIENMRFFFAYQCHYMYWRYFMWNFAGRQNDLQGHGEVYKGNWISGISWLDNARLGDQSLLPQELKENKGHNVYYMLPLLLGIIGIVFQLGKGKEGYHNFLITFLLFFLTGLAIVIYLNQTPLQPRERDYAYAGSFYAFCIWIGLGAMALAEGCAKFSNNNTVRTCVAVFAVLVCLGVPALMGQQNWDDHDRSDRYACRDFGANYLKSIEKEAVIFTNGDNDTFPLWYNQEVEGFGTDSRVCNLSYLQTDWYIGQMKRPYYDSPALPISWKKKDYAPNANEVAYVRDTKAQEMSVEDAYKWLLNPSPSTKYKGESYLPTGKLYIAVDKEKAMASPLFTENGVCRYTADEIEEKMYVKPVRRLIRSEMMVLDMLQTNQWERPIYFAVTVGDSYYLGLQKYFELTGLAYQVTPVASENGEPRVNVEKMYDNMMHKFRFGNMNKKGIYIDENLMRMCRTHRMMFSYLAEELVKRKDYERAVEVLDYAEEQLPGYNISHDYTSASMAGLYFEAGEQEKGRKIMDEVCATSADYIKWGLALDKKEREYIKTILDRHFYVLGYCLQALNRYSEDDMMEKYEKIWVAYSSTRK